MAATQGGFQGFDLVLEEPFLKGIRIVSVSARPCCLLLSVLLEQLLTRRFKAGRRTSLHQPIAPDAGSELQELLPQRNKAIDACPSTVDHVRKDRGQVVHRCSFRVCQSLHRPGSVCVLIEDVTERITSEAFDKVCDERCM